MSGADPHRHAPGLRARPLWERVVSLPLIVLIKVYQSTLSPVVGRQCRFSPTCSWFALDALRAYPPHVALGMIVRRVGRCHPFSAGGYDPVPPRDDDKRA
ncbi:MAG: membrane protein insertion efficiency factor YidD [Phycisphaerales bacterium]|nr:membrane protein insertion efficiency factor YidD [Phycisphaerales bacterium]